MSLCNEYWNKNKNEFFEKIKPNLEELVSLYGGKIVISLIPPKKVCIDSDWEGQAEQLKEYFSKFGKTIPVIGTMQQTSCPEYLNWFYHLNIHFSEEGHEIYYKKVITPNIS